MGEGARRADEGSHTARTNVMTSRNLTPYLQVAPLALVMAVFVAIPLAVLITLSFWLSDGISLTPAFSLDNYRNVLASPITWKLLLATLKFAAITWVFTLIIGFTCSYFLALFFCKI